MRDDIRPGGPPARHEQQDQESLVVEIAWLIIDGAKLLRRLRRILARLRGCAYHGSGLGQWAERRGELAGGVRE